MTFRRLWAGRIILLTLFPLWLCGPAAQAALPDFTELVEEVAPAVVNISTTRSTSAGGFMGQNPDLEELPEFFRHFFGDRLPGNPGGPGRGPSVQSAGSGFIVSDDGYVLTNNHVVEGAEEIFVRLSDRRELKAELVGADPQSDLAVLRVEARDLPEVELGSSKDLKPGEWVVAIGAPFGFEHSVTAGIVSATGRSLPSENYVPFIQTDVAINPGNSGGPLFNLDGEVIGINSQIYTRSGGFMGVSFSIPIDVAMDVMEQLRKDGQVRRGWLGVLIQEVTKDLAESFGLDKPQGAAVVQIMESSPAAQSGLRVGDVIVEFDGAPIRYSSELPHRVGRKRPGETVNLKVVREGKTRDISLKIGQLPSENADVTPRPAGTREDASTLNLTLQALKGQALQEAGVEQGLRVTEVYAGPAADAGVQPGDIIVTMNNRPVGSVEDFRKLVRDMKKGKGVPLLIMRNGQPVFIVVKRE